MNNEYHYKDITYQLKQSDRKTTSIYIERDGSVTVLAPSPFTLDKIEHLLEKKRRWIYRHLAEWQDINRTRCRNKQYVNGESFLYLGRQYQLQLVKNPTEVLQLLKGRFCLAEKAVPKATVHFKQFYKARLELKLAERLPSLASAMGVTPSAIGVMELQHRWGSCSPQKALHFHWKCAMMPLSILDYIIVHELAHLKEPHHTARFWYIVERSMPDYQQHKTWLKYNGASLSLASS